MKFKSKLFIYTFILIFQTSISTTFAHDTESEPFFKINNKPALPYHVEIIPSSNQFTLPQDIAPERYRPNTEIKFEIIKDRLPTTASALEDSNFYWEFGDGITSTGILNTHIYNIEGSYTVNVYIHYTKTNEKELLQSTMLYVTNNPTQKPPVLKIKVNNYEYDKAKGNLKLDITKDNTYEANLINPESNQNIKNVNYIWDMSDGKSLKGNKINYHHSDNFLILNPLVRATTSDGFIYHAEVIIENAPSKSNISNPFPNLIIINGAAIILLAVFLLVLRLKKVDLKM